MSPELHEALNALLLGMSTVFSGLLMLLLAMKLVGGTIEWRLRYKERKANDARLAAKGGNAAMVEVEQEGRLSGDLVAAIGLALQLDQEVLDEMEAQRLTWTRMFKPFSPWLMDSKNTLHTHRIRYHAVGRTGSIVRDRQERR